MKFALVYQYDPTTDGPTEAELPEWFTFDDDVKASGAFVYAEGFHAVGAGRTLTRRGGEVVVADGVAAQTGPVVAGFVVIDVADMATALEWAERVPTAKYGSVDVRPVVEWNG
ncbi:YciI family protein [Kribbella italica]|uniref:YCII-related domain-containing protein n=1 Tax=Kribbella italica TaxID=1540520 RepID=A0A7W9J6A4_9ACTN|nr:YciI family protein [Kribbella italica]MBB5835708.1 hypothetical protein [Kribbella italica]